MGHQAYKEAARYGEANVVASSKDKTFSYIPKLDPSTFTKDADYFHICLNNTIYGTKWNTLPETGNVPLVADISSCILSEPLMSAGSACCMPALRKTWARRLNSGNHP